MQRTLYLLLVILSIFVIRSISIERKPRSGDSALDSKKKISAIDKDDLRQKDKYDHDHDDDVDDNYSSLSSYADNRYSAFSLPESNPRPRTRWTGLPPSPPPPPPPPPSSYDDFINGNDWSRFEHPKNFPTLLPSLSFDNNPMLSNSPSCTSLVDPQYPIFADTCGAVPQARYSLPNLFGHRERWQIAQILTTLVRSADPACTRASRLLLCPVLFPPCPTRHESPPILPCQSYCRAIKARCATPALDLLPCEILPYSSDLCPTNQAYGSFIPPGAYPSMNQPLPMPNGLPPSNYPISRSFPSLQSLLSSQGFQSTLTPSSLPSPPALTAQPIPPVNLYNGGPYATDGTNQMLGDYPSRLYTNDYRQASVYTPVTRSSTETRPTSEVRPSTETRSQAPTRSSVPPSVVRA